MIWDMLVGLFRRLIKVDRQCGYVFQARPRGGGGGGWLDKQPLVVVFRDGRTCLPSLPFLLGGFGDIHIFPFLRSSLPLLGTQPW